MFNEQETNAILSDFPQINMKCCNENIAKFHIDDINNMSNYDFYTAIPEGKKYIIWFTSYNNKKACFLLTFSYKKIKIFKKIFVPFTNELVNTVFRGTNFYIKGKQNSYITLEDVLFYKENDVSRLTEIEKFTIFQSVFNNKNFTLPFVNAYANYNNNIGSNNIIGLPFISKDISVLTKEIELLPYKVDVILCKNFNDNNEKSEKIKYIKHADTPSDKQINKQYTHVKNEENITITKSEKDEKLSKVNIFDIINKVPSKKPPAYAESNTPYTRQPNTPYTRQPNTPYTKPYNNNSNFNENYKQNTFNKEHVFVVKPNIQNDIYNLYMLSHDSKTEKFYDTAYIPNYTTSVMMNKLFRNIKENDNLDRLEESDDEDEFENENIDKFVYLEKTYPMICKYNYKFKKWYPVSLAKKESKIVTSVELQNK
jgi:hypothetical protein